MLTKINIKPETNQMQKANPKSIAAPKVHWLSFRMIHCLFRHSTDAGYIKLIVEINSTITSRAGECRLAPILCEGISPLCPLHPCCCALLRGSESSPLPPPISTSEGASQCVETFPLHSSLPEVQVLSLFFCLCFFFFLLPYPGTWEFSCLWGTLRSFASIQQVFCTSCSTCRCIFDVLVGKKVISTSYSSAILKVVLLHYFYKASCYFQYINIHIQNK